MAIQSLIPVKLVPSNELLGAVFVPPQDFLATQATTTATSTGQTVELHYGIPYWNRVLEKPGPKGPWVHATNYTARRIKGWLCFMPVEYLYEPGTWERQYKSMQRFFSGSKTPLDIISAGLPYSFVPPNGVFDRAPSYSEFTLEQLEALAQQYYLEATGQT